ncbi:alpha-hydroxy acid oxidase [Cupriavidus respiraculi]|uniref:(S)-mandelate dehydrogenase n=1 Tax=Cupriavidus respiraculi TaxID=195930 RepID=A0ABN7Y5C3_9BURK|nr:alpha-hydroxy acid oxidase [Cupriavidus respiraculi]CAG9168579.1 (S)-mandelate dehydrogenase [Cupriavidus respiraculi]
MLCLDDFEAAARRRLPAPVFGYIAGAAERYRSFQGNRDAFDDVGLVTRVLVDISRRSTETTLFGRTYASPFGIAPMGLAALSAYRGDIVLAQAAAAENVPMVMSGSSLIRLEEVVRVNADAWFQAYLPGDQPNIVALIERVRAAGYGTLVITVDTPVPPNRENFARAGFSAPLRPSAKLAWEGITHPRWLFGTFLKTVLRHGVPHFENNYATRGAPILSPNVQRDFSDRGHLDWRHFALIRRLWPGTLVIKGILDARDARIAVDAGADGIIVSNHGGRQLDGAVAPLRVLPGIVRACPGVPVMLDSGVRRGSDAIKALALGARFVFVGRPFCYAAAVQGLSGVRKAIELMKQEISRNMAMLGATSVDAIDESFLWPSPQGMAAGPAAARVAGA